MGPGLSSDSKRLLLVDLAPHDAVCGGFAENRLTP